MNLKKKANFWIRAIARLIDSSLFASIIVLLAWWFTTPSPLRFRKDWLFYAWIMLCLGSILIIWFLIPRMFGGRTIGSIITRTELSYEGHLIKVLLARESIMSVSWGITMILIAAFANHSGFTRMFSTKDVSLTSMEVLRLSVIRAFGTILSMVQLINGASLLISPVRRSIVDKVTNTNIVWTNKYEEIIEELKGPQPKIVRRQKIEFIEE